MNLPDLIVLVFSNLNRMRGRVVMTAMGVVIGTSAIVVLIALSTGLQQQTVGNFASFGTLNQITVFSRSRFGGGSTGTSGTSSTSNENLTPDVITNLSQIPGVVAVTPYEQYRGQSTIKLNRLNGFGTLYGINPTVIPYMNFKVTEGSANLDRGSVIVGSGVGSSFTQSGTGSQAGGEGPRRAFGGGGAGGLGFLFGRGLSSSSQNSQPTLDLYGQTLLLDMTRQGSTGGTETRTERLHVGGVLASTGGNQDYNIYMSMNDMTDLLTWAQGTRPDWKAQGYDQLLVIAQQDAQVTLSVTQQITNDGYFAISTNSIVQSLNSTFSIIQAVLGGIASIALLVAAIGIANTMVMAVLERTREIGLMKAIGARNRDILSVFIAEATTIGLMGGITGILVGIGLAQIVDLFAVNYLASSGSTVSSVVAIPLWLPLFAIGFSMLVGMAAGIYPAFRAVQLDPVNALKYE